MLAHAPRRAVLVAALLLASAVTEDIRLALLVPLLAIAGPGGTGDGASPIRQFLETGAAAFGATLTLPVLLGTFVLLAAVQSAVAWQRQAQIAAMRHGFVDRLRERLYTATANAEWLFLVRRR